MKEQIEESCQVVHLTQEPSTGYYCLIRRIPHGERPKDWPMYWDPHHYCGYVMVPPGHRLHGKDYCELCYDGIHLRVHGGLTASGRAAGYSDVKRYKDSGFCGSEVFDHWSFGFECNHGGDTLAEQNLSYVIEQCMSLALQLKECDDDLEAFINESK